MQIAVAVSIQEVALLETGGYIAGENRLGIVNQKWILLDGRGESVSTASGC